MQPFEYVRAGDAREAVEAASRAPGAAFLAGGTNLVDMMKLDVVAPAVLVDINALPLDGIERLDSGTLRIGALARNHDVAWHPRVRRRYPVLAQALLAGASGALRNMATVGGNLLQRTRCAYFRDPTYDACNKRAPGSGCTALTAHHRGHALLGTSDHCIATHPSDMAVALTALDAVVVTLGPHGERRIPIERFYLTPGRTPEREHPLEHDELVVAVDVPRAPWLARSLYLKLRDRESYEFALVSVACALDVHDGVVCDARVALGGVATVPWRARAAEHALIGAPAGGAAFEAAAEAALASARAGRDNAFKIPLAKRAVMRALETLEAA